MTEPEANFDALQQHVDELHHGIDRANLPPADLWNSVRAEVKSGGKEEEKSAMNNYANHLDTTIPPAPVPPSVARGFRHHLSVASTLALVLTVALAGWLVTMQVNQPDGSNGQFALFGQSDSGTCDVEPLSVDRVMEIVKNPTPYLENGPAGEPTVPEVENNPMFVELYEPEWTTDVRGTAGQPDEVQFNDVASTVDTYLQCHVFGTVGQNYRFWSPFVIQRQVLAQFPVFADEESVRAWLEVELDQPALSHNEFWERSLSNYDVGSISVNPDPALAVQQPGNNYYFAELITVGVSVENAEGETVLLTTATGNQLISQGTNTHVLVITVAQPQESDQWYVVAHYPLGG